MTVIFAVVAFGLGALVIDVGAMTVERREAQKAADLAALAAGQEIGRPGGDVTAAATSYVNENGWAGAPQVVLDDNRVTVTTSSYDVPLLFFPAVQGLTGGSGADNPSVRATATAEVRSPRGAGLFPVAVPESQPPTAGDPSEWCLKDATGGQSSACIGPETGNFKWVDINRSSGGLADNTRLGAEFDATIASGALSGQECTGAFVASGVVTEASAPFDCLSLRPGNVTSAAADGLLDASGNRCTGRLAVANGTSCSASPNRWDEFFDPFSQRVDADILDDPRFGYVPRMGAEMADLSGASEVYPIVGFYGAYITGLFNLNTPCDDGGCNQINVIRAELFELDAVTPGVLGSGPERETVAYLGSGPRVVVLVE